MTLTILPTRNTDLGFWGTICRVEDNPAADPAGAWEIASRSIAETTEASAEGVRDFFDSRHGRHFADEGREHPLHRRASPQRSMPPSPGGWAGESAAGPSRDEGIPRGLPHLTGWVAHFQILDEMQG